MKSKYQIRQATAIDVSLIRQAIRESVAEEKKLLNPSMITQGFIEEFVDKIIEKGDMIVVENQNHEMELIGVVHQYNHFLDKCLKELSFVSCNKKPAFEKELIDWLHGEMQNRHQDVFRVELASPVFQAEDIRHFSRMGMCLEGKSLRQLNHPAKKLPLSWINAA